MEQWVMVIIRVQVLGWLLKVGVVMEVSVVVWEEVRAVPELLLQLAVEVGSMAELALHLQAYVRGVVEAEVLPEARQMMVAQAVMVADGLVQIPVEVARDRIRVLLLVMAYLIAVILYQAIPAVLELLVLLALPV